MKIKKEYAILFFVIAVLVFYIYSEKGEKTHYTLPEVEKIDTDEISKLMIRKKDAEITLMRQGDLWLMGEKNYPADKSKVDAMLDKIRNLTLSTLVSESKNYRMYELDDDKKIDIQAFKGENSVRRITIGKPASSYRHTFVLIEDDPKVYHAEGNMRSDFDKKVAELRDKTVMKFGDEIAEIVLKKDEKEMTLIRETAPVSVEVTQDETQKQEQKTEEPSARWMTADAEPVNEKDVDEIINTLSNLQCDDFIEDEQKEEFDAPVFTVSLKGIKTYTVSLFEKRDEKYPAISSESDYPFLLSEWKAKKIMKEPDSLIERPSENP